MLRTFLHYQEATGKTVLGQLAATDAQQFLTAMQNRKPYSNGYINKLIQSLHLFSKYIRATGKSSIGFDLQLLPNERDTPCYLTKAEMQTLYHATTDSILGIRDRAMLALYYGCGLRLNEGANVLLQDIDTTKKILHVRKGKCYKERLIPISDKDYDTIQFYIETARRELLQETKTDFLFIGAAKGTPMQRQSIYIRIRALASRSKLTKKIGTHTLRHSIATHLLQSGMQLEKIQLFLGHGNLDSTQIYTHLVNEEANMKVKTKK